jgi:hypothetical protein
MIDLELLAEWLGPGGAMAGLEKSDLTISELADLAKARGIEYKSAMKRGELISALVKSVNGRIKKTPEELMEMDAQELKHYFRTVRASNSEIIQVLLSLDIRPGSAARRNLADFAAQEISDIGMYRRIASGAQRK